MTQQAVGYELVDWNGNVVQSWGGIWGQMPGFPNPVILPNGDAVYGANQIGQFGDWTMREWMMDAPAPTVPASISDRQFAQGLAHNGLITNDEALAWVSTGTLPAAFVAFIESLPVEQQFDVKIVLVGATQFDRANPLVSAFGANANMNSAALDAFWIYCSNL
jgi:hypothetical protein